MTECLRLILEKDVFPIQEHLGSEVTPLPVPRIRRQHQSRLASSGSPIQTVLQLTLVFVPAGVGGGTPEALQMTAMPFPDTRSSAATNQLIAHELERTLPLDRIPQPTDPLLLRAKEDS